MLTWWVIISTKTEDEMQEKAPSVVKLMDEAKNSQIDLKIIFPEQFDIIVTKDDRKSILIDWKTVPLPDFVIPRMGASTTYFALAVIRHLERLGVTIINSSESIEKVKDKLYTEQILAENSLPVPKTMMAKFPIDIDLIEKHIGFPLVMKTISWSQWNWVFLCENREKFEEVIQIITATSDKKANLIIQEFIKSSYWKDLRVIVVWWKVIACMERNWAKGDFRANFSRWWTVKEFELNEEIEWLSIESSKVLWLDVAWVDLLFSDWHFKICEVNSSPWFKWIESCCDVNISREIFNFIKIRKWVFD